MNHPLQWLWYSTVLDNRSCTLTLYWQWSNVARNLELCQVALGTVLVGV